MFLLCLILAKILCDWASFYLVCFPLCKSHKGSSCADKHRRVISQFIHLCYEYIPLLCKDTTVWHKLHESKALQTWNFQLQNFIFFPNKNKSKGDGCLHSPLLPFPELLIKLNYLKPNVRDCSLWNINAVSPFHSILSQETNTKWAYFAFQPSLTS